MNIIDLRATYGDTYQITIDPAAEGRRNIDPMYLIIPCKHGEIYPFGGEYLAVLVYSSRAGNKLRKMPELTVHQDAEDAVVFKVHARDLEKIFKIVGARRKRHVSPEHMRKIGLETAYRAEIKPKTRRKRGK